MCLTCAQRCQPQGGGRRDGFAQVGKQAMLHTRVHAFKASLQASQEPRALLSQREQCGVVEQLFGSAPCRCVVLSPWCLEFLKVRWAWASGPTPGAAAPHPAAARNHKKCGVRHAPQAKCDLGGGTIFDTNFSISFLKLSFNLISSSLKETITTSTVELS